MTQRELKNLGDQALAAFREAVRKARVQHRLEKRPFYVFQKGRVVDYFRERRHGGNRKAA